MPAEKKPTREDSPQSELSESPELDLYGMLGVKNDATEGEIKTAYKKLALKYHPGVYTPQLREPCNLRLHRKNRF